MVKQGRDESISDYVGRFKDVKNRCLKLSISEKDLANLALDGLHSHFKIFFEGFGYYSINQLQLRALNQEYRFKKAKESYKVHQSDTCVDCESNTSDDEKKENNSDMDKNSIMLRTELNGDCSEFIVS